MILLGGGMQDQLREHTLSARRHWRASALPTSVNITKTTASTRPRRFPITPRCSDTVAMQEERVKRDLTQKLARKNGRKNKKGVYTHTQVCSARYDYQCNVSASGGCLSFD